MEINKNLSHKQIEEILADDSRILTESEAVFLICEGWELNLQELPEGDGK